MRKILELKENDELIIVKEETKKSVGLIKLKNNLLEIKKNEDNINEYYKIKNIDIGTLKCYEYLNDFINNCVADSMPANLWQHFNKIYEYFYEKVVGISSDRVISRDFQSVIKYKKEV